MLKNLAKWVWIAAVITFIVFFAIRKMDLIVQMFSLFTIDVLLGAAILVFAAKLCLVTNMMVATMQFNITLGWWDCFRIYNMTQLAKYVPGSIWQFVGRIAILRKHGIEMSVIRDSLLAEHLWVISSAALIACVMIWASSPEFFVDWLAGREIDLDLAWLLVMLVLVASVVFLSNHRLLRWLVRLSPPLKVIPVLIFTWLFLGFSLWVTLTSFTTNMPSPIYVVGIYSLAYVVGFMVPFAPAGLGIREAILTFSLMPYVGSDEAIFLAAINRIIYFIVEIVIASICLRKNTSVVKYE